jgi:hypothetical protein
VKKWLVLGLLAATAVAAFAGTCVIKNGRLTTIDGKKVFAAQIDNDSGVDILQHNYIVAFVDGSGNVLETKTVEGCLRSLQDGGTNYYSVKSTTAAGSIANSLSRIAFDSAFKVGQTESIDATLSEVRIRREDDSLKVSGKVKNNDSEQLDDINVCVVVKDEDGNILVVAKTSNIDDLDEDDEDDFSITVQVLDDENDVDKVDVFVDGLVDGVPTDAESDVDNNVTNCSDPTNTPTRTNTPIGTATPTNTALPTLTVTNTAVPATGTATPCFD